MKAPAHLPKSKQILWKMEFNFHHDCLKQSEEEAMRAANLKVSKIDRLNREILKRSEHQWIDITTGKPASYQP